MNQLCCQEWNEERKEFVCVNCNWGFKREVKRKCDWKPKIHKRTGKPIIEKGKKG